ncbi:EamA family transporter [Oenococcus sicerae]|uniref:EamA family transporter n=1 Tax=Oenococcus sicerae TaxID=2203724 RepID=A0ABX5QL30_9LACO|nr:DMT family transporter [Oenococcus sicerae]QAS69485.1 EamA family transporter [Oenococcus sicerae]
MKKAYLLIAFATLMFSSMEIALKMAGASFNPIQLNLIRFFIGALVLLPFAIKSIRRNTDLTPRLADFAIFALTGFMCVIISMSLFQIAIVVDEASTVAVLFSSNPVFALIFVVLILRERIARAEIISTVVSIIGLIVIANPAHLTNPLGLTLALLSALTFGLYSVISRFGSVKLNYDGITMTCFTFFAGSLELLIIAWVSKITVVGSFLRSVGLTDFANIPILRGINLAHLPILLFIGVLVTGGGFAAYFMAMEITNVSTASLVFFIKPGLAPILATLILHEKIVPTTIIGIVIILIGSTLTFISNYRRTHLPIRQKTAD